jgi:hypothetical protein
MFPEFIIFSDAFPTPLMASNSIFSDAFPTPLMASNSIFGKL